MCLPKCTRFWYHISEQWRLWRVYMQTQTHQSPCCSHTQRIDVDESSSQKLGHYLFCAWQHRGLLEAFAHIQLQWNLCKTAIQKMTNGSLMHVKSIWSILLYIWNALSDNWSFWEWLFYTGFLFVWFDSLRLSQQFFSYIVTGLPGWNQY